MPPRLALFEIWREFTSVFETLAIVKRFDGSVIKRTWKQHGDYYQNTEIFTLEIAEFIQFTDGKCKL